MFSSKSYLSVLVSLLAVLVVAAEAAKIEFNVGPAEEPIEYSHGTRTTEMGVVARLNLEEWLNGFREAVVKYLSTVSAPEFLHTRLAWAREAKVLRKALEKQGKTMRSSSFFTRDAELQKQTQLVLQFFSSVLADSYDPKASTTQQDIARFSAEEVDHYGKLLTQLSFKLSDPMDLIDINSITIHGIKLREILADYLRLMNKTGLELAQTALLDGVNAI